VPATIPDLLGAAPWISEAEGNTMMKPEAVRCVLLADRHHGLTEGVRGMLETSFDAVVMVADEASLVESAKRLQPMVAVVDLSLMAGESLRWLKWLRALCPELKVILLSVHDEPSVCQAAMAAGADGYVLKRDIATQLLNAVDEVLAGRRYVPPEMAQEPSPPEGTKGQTN
jgi:DNA-binding NarL/FixJ family response regulator